MKQLLKSSKIFLAICFAIFFACEVQAESSSASYDISQETENPIGVEVESGSYKLEGDLGDFVSGESSSENYKVVHGLDIFSPDPVLPPVVDDDPPPAGAVVSVLPSPTPSDAPDSDTPEPSDDVTDSDEPSDDFPETEVDVPTETEEPELEIDEVPDTEIDEEAGDQAEEVGEDDASEEGEIGEGESDTPAGDDAGASESPSIGDKFFRTIGGIGSSKFIRSVKDFGNKILNVFGIGEQGLEGEDLDILIIGQAFDNIAESAKEALKSDAGQTANTAVFGTVSAMSILLVAAQMDSFAQVPYAFFNLFGIFAYRKRRQRKEGKVYDAKTGQPIAFARIVIYDEGGKAKEVKVTDKYGAYFFLVPSGKYRLDVQKKGYELMDEEAIGRINTIYRSAYTQKKLLNFEREGMVISSIPLLPKERKERFLDLFKKKSAVFILNCLFYAGFFASILLVIWHPSVYNAMVLFIYLLLYFLRLANFARPKWGVVSSDKNITQAFSFVNVFEEDEPDKFLARTVTDEKGRYAFILDRGKYDFEVITTDQKRAKEKISVKKRDIVAKDIKI